MRLYLINNFISPIYPNGKVLYFNEANYQFLAYYYSNENNFSNEYIRESIDETSLPLMGKIEIDNHWLSEIQVDLQFQRHGIGSMLIELALHYLDLLYIPGVKSHPAYRYSLTPSGECLIASCLRRGVIKKSHCYFSLSIEDMLEEGAEDPELDSAIVQEAASLQRLYFKFEKKTYSLTDIVLDSEEEPEDEMTDGSLDCSSEEESHVSPPIVNFYGCLYSQPNSNQNTATPPNSDCFPYPPPSPFLFFQDSESFSTFDQSEFSHYETLCTNLYTKILEKAEHIVDDHKKHEVMDRANEIFCGQINEKRKKELEQLLINIQNYLQSPSP